MASGRFRLLERDPDAAPEAEEQGGSFQRPLERDGQLTVDRGGAIETRFCRRCEAENSPGARRCTNCGARIGGPDQDAFDAMIHAERDARIREREAAAVRAAAEAEAERQERLRTEAEADAQAAETEQRGGRVRARLAIALVGLCLLAVFSATVHLIFAQSIYAIRWGPLVQILIAVVAAVAIFQRVKDAIDDL